MRRPLWLRVTTALWGLWFVLVLTGPPSLHACPVHGGHSAHMAGMASMASMASMADMTHHAPAQPHHAATCTCLGQCCGATAVVPPTPSVAFAPAFVIAATPAFVADTRGPIVRRAYARPFANGPPSPVDSNRI